jgi:hypothetical protein
VRFVEFVAPLKKSSRRSMVLAAMYYLHRYENVEAMRAEAIRSLLIAARLPNAKTMNVPDVLNKSGAYVDSPGSDGTRRLWVLTDTGLKEVRRLLDLPEAEVEIEVDVATLTKLLGEVTDADARDFLEEAVACLRFGALRAAVVFLWSGAITILRDDAWQFGEAKVNAALQVHNPKQRAVKKLEDFAYVKDVQLLEILFDLGVIDKTQKTILGQALDLRNGCGHPTSYRPKEKKVSSFIEDVVGIVF